MSPPRLGVIGFPIAHSRSPAMHRAALAALGLPWTYDAIPIDPGDVETFIRGAAVAGFRGLNVTIPHKLRVVELCECDEIARSVGAVNTLVFEGSLVRGTNTDVYGFERALDRLEGAPAARTVVLGIGGAARAAVASRLASGAEVVVVARRPSSLVIGGRPVEVASWDRASFERVLPPAELLVDATSRGLRDVDDGTVPIEALSPRAIVLDLVVRAQTPLTASAQARGLVADTGAEMLLHQGARSLELWTGVAAPVEVMRAALLKEIPEK